MKRKIASFTGGRPIFTGSPAIVPGGFNLDVVKQKFPPGMIIPGGSLAIYDEVKRTVWIVKTASVVEVNSENAKEVTLKVDEFYAPIFAVGDKVAKGGAISGTFANAAQITAISQTDNSCVITLSKAISGLTAGDVIVEVVKDASDNAAEIGKANALTLADVEVSEFETGVDVTADTMQYALFERRVPVIPESQKDGNFLQANPHVKLTQSY
ncbi:hypothetical protein [Alloprevotella tannerae]|uniref:Head fiber protein n=1 Tax=Alloprevotella tannerae TaxID=76122 RepID=A0A929RXH8_9BACT|nr:hypothetical protein [Alloprevotella tannerae]MBF0969514.1 hypothetical protein [Alloprevotella tannerae]